ncbi:MAG: hypothetical protein AAF585_06220 [Verrucomicrobiota bacterium]
MRAKITVSALIASSLAALIFCLIYLPLYPFVGLIHDGSGDHNLTPIHLKKTEDLDAITAVLDEYGERYWRTDSAVWIPLGLSLDDQLRWNYTSKAEDPK